MKSKSLTTIRLFGNGYRQSGTLKSVLSIFAPSYLSPTIATLLIILSTIGYGMVPLFAKSLTSVGLAASAIIFYRNFLPALLFFRLLSFAPHKRIETVWVIVAGMVMSLAWIAYVEALKEASIATVGVIYMTYPLFTLLLGMLWLGQVPTRKTFAAGLLIIVAALIALAPASVGTANLKPLLLSFLTPLGFAFGIIVITSKTSQLIPAERLAGISLGGAASLLPVMWTLEFEALIPGNLTDWLLIAGIALITRVIPSMLYHMAAPQIGSERTAIVGSTELPIMFVVGWLAFGEQITASQYIAALLVMIAIWMTSMNRRARVVTGAQEES